jgi:hypothetical protein
MPKLRVIIKPPPEPTGDAETDVAAQRDYLLQMSEELAYVLTHLEADNINDSTFERISEMIPKASVIAPPMDGAGSAGGSSTWARGDHQHPTDTSRASDADLTAHTGNTSNPHSVTKAQVGLGNVADERQYSAQNPPPTPSAADVGAIPTTAKGTAGGVAELDSNGMVPSAQLPSYVDDVLEYASLSAFPVTGESGKIYVALDTGRTYRWSGSAYVEISESLALGETSSTAYRGDRGKTAYDHSQVVSGNPHNVTAAEAGAVPTTREINGHALSADITLTAADVGARADTWMPTATDVGARPDTWTPTAADVGAVPTTREVNGHALSSDITLDATDVGARADDWVPDAEDIPYDNTTSGLMATDVQNAIDEIAQGGGGGGTAASAVSYDNTGSGLTATNVQDAIDEVLGDIPTQASDISAQPSVTASGILKGDGAGGVSAAVSGTDYQAPLTAGTDYATPAQLEAKANQSQLAYVETGTTASRAYAVGKYFCWNGLLCRAKTAISSGASFTMGTNCETTMVGDEIQKKAFFDTTSASSKTLTFGANTRAMIFASSTNTNGMGIYAVSSASNYSTYVKALVSGSAITMTASGSAITVSSSTNVVYEIMMLAGDLPTIT